MNKLPAERISCYVEKLKVEGMLITYKKLSPLIKLSYLTKAIFFVLILWAVPPAQAQTARLIAQKAFPSVVMLVMEDANGQPISLGSGFFVHSDIVATNLHVVKGAARGYVKIVRHKKKYDIAGFVAVDTRRDLALLKISRVFAPVISLGDSRQVAVGDEVYAVGNPQGLEGTFSRGIVSGIRTVGSDTLLQITAPISPGSSGGPVLSTERKVIGIAVATIRGGQNLNFAIPSGYLTSLLSNIKRIAPLSERKQHRGDKSIVDKLGKRGSEGVIGGKLIWELKYAQSGDYSISLRNRMRHPVMDVYCLVVFYDNKGDPIDVDVIRYRPVIPAGLAKRVTSRVDGSVQKLTTRRGSQIPNTKVEVRVLDFKLSN